jgi:hypothetical protein
MVDCVTLGYSMQHLIAAETRETPISFQNMWAVKIAGDRDQAFFWVAMESLRRAYFRH